MQASGALRFRTVLSYFYAAAFFLCAARVTWAAYAFGVNIGRLLFVGLLLWLAFALARLAPAAMKAAGVLCLLGAVFVPFAVLNPFAVGDYLAQGIDPPTISQTMYWLVPTELFLLLSAYIFDWRAPTHGQAGSEA
jgi:hypothetical protein